jgi:hypothetical protein
VDAWSLRVRSPAAAVMAVVMMVRGVEPESHEG